MNSDRAIALLRLVYREVEAAAWATACAVLVYVMVFVAPQLSSVQAAAEQHRIQEAASENEAYCAKWGMGPTTAMHNECMADLHQLRDRIENRFAEELDF